MCENNSKNIVLKNNRLSVEISSPGTLYKSSRFDWNGFIIQITLDDKHTFCVPESLVPGKGTGGCGLCGEFGIDEAVGYDETPVDGLFHKIGVGLLKKPDMQPYKFFRSYPVINEGSSIIEGKYEVTFSTASSVHNGYGYNYSKTAAISDNHLLITYMLHNTGTKKINTTEYCHNFVGIDNEKVNGSYYLKVPCNVFMKDVVGDFIVKKNEITWPDKEMKEEFYCHLQGYSSNRNYSWEIYNKNLDIGVREADNFPVANFAIWGYRHVISPETFVKIELEPGSSKTWSREYEFFNGREQ